MSIRPTIATERASRSNTRVSKHGCSVTHDLCLQHFFSSAVGIGRHFPQMHQLGTPLADGCCPGGCCPCGTSTISLADCSPPVRLYASIISRRQSSMFRVFTNSYICFQLFQSILYVEVTCRSCCCASCKVATGSAGDGA